MDEFTLYLQRHGIKSKKSIIAHTNRLKKILPYDKREFTRLLAGMNPPSINKYCQTAKHWCDFKGIPYSENDFKRVEEVSNPRITMSDAEIMAFLALPSRHTMFWKVLAFQGCRPNEVCKLTVNDVDLANNSIIIKNTSNIKKGRILAIHELIEKDFIEYVQTCKTHFLFPPRGKDYPMSVDSIDAEFRKKKELLGIRKNVTPYSLRHSLATRLLNEDASLFSVQDIYGHKSSDTTKIYYRGNLAAQRKALKKDTIYQAQNPTKGIADLWEQMRVKLLALHVERQKISEIENKLFSSIN